MRLAITYRERKFIVVVSEDCSVAALKDEIERVYCALFQSSGSPHRICELQTLSGCVLYEGYRVSSLLSDNDVIVAVGGRGERGTGGGGSVFSSHSTDQIHPFPSPSQYSYHGCSPREYHTPVGAHVFHPMGSGPYTPQSYMMPPHTGTMLLQSPSSRTIGSQCPSPEPSNGPSTPQSVFSSQRHGVVEVGTSTNQSEESPDSESPLGDLSRIEHRNPTQKLLFSTPIASGGEDKEDEKNKDKEEEKREAKGQLQSNVDVLEEESTNTDVSREGVSNKSVKSKEPRKSKAHKRRGGETSQSTPKNKGQTKYRKGSPMQSKDNLPALAAVTEVQSSKSLSGSVSLSELTSIKKSEVSMSPEQGKESFLSSQTRKRKLSEASTITSARKPKTRLLSKKAKPKSAPVVVTSDHSSDWATSSDESDAATKPSSLMNKDKKATRKKSIVKKPTQKEINSSIESESDVDHRASSLSPLHGSTQSKKLVALTDEGEPSERLYQTPVQEKVTETKENTNNAEIDSDTSSGWTTDEEKDEEKMETCSQEPMPTQSERKSGPKNNTSGSEKDLENVNNRSTKFSEKNKVHEEKQNESDINSKGQSKELLDSWSGSKPSPVKRYSPQDGRRLRQKKIDDTSDSINNQCQHEVSDKASDDKASVPSTLSNPSSESGKNGKTDDKIVSDKTLPNSRGEISEDKGSEVILAPNSLPSDEEVKETISPPREDLVTVIQESQDYPECSRSPSPEIPLHGHLPSAASPSNLTSPHLQKIQRHTTLKNSPEKKCSAGSGRESHMKEMSAKHTISETDATQSDTSMKSKNKKKKKKSKGEGSKSQKSSEKSDLLNNLLMEGSETQGYSQLESETQGQNGSGGEPENSRKKGDRRNKKSINERSTDSSSQSTPHHSSLPDPKNTDHETEVKVQEGSKSNTGLKSGGSSAEEISHQPFNEPQTDNGTVSDQHTKKKHKKKKKKVCRKLSSSQVMKKDIKLVEVTTSEGLTSETDTVTSDCSSLSASLSSKKNKGREKEPTLKTQKKAMEESKNCSSHKDESLMGDKEDEVEGEEEVTEKEEEEVDGKDGKEQKEEEDVEEGVEEEEEEEEEEKEEEDNQENKIEVKEIKNASFQSAKHEKKEKLFLKPTAIPHSQSSPNKPKLQLSPAAKMNQYNRVSPNEANNTAKPKGSNILSVFSVTETELSSEESSSERKKPTSRLGKKQTSKPSFLSSLSSSRGKKKASQVKRAQPIARGNSLLHTPSTSHFSSESTMRLFSLTNSKRSSTHRKRPHPSPSKATPTKQKPKSDSMVSPSVNVLPNAEKDKKTTNVSVSELLADNLLW